MENVQFALGPDNRYLFNGPKAWATNNLPSEIKDVLVKKDLKDVLCVAFGPDEHSYFFAYESKDSRTFGIWGPNTPPEFKEWLIADGGESIAHDLRNIQVAFGPNESFIAWSPDSIRWSNIPKALEKTLQSWLIPSGWKSGPPRQIGLGSDGAYFAVSEYGVWSFSFPYSWAVAKEGFESLAKNQDRLPGLQVRLRYMAAWKVIDAQQYISLDPKEANRWACVFEDTWVYSYNAGSEEDHNGIADSFASSNILTHYKTIRAQAAKAEKKAREEAAKAEKARRKAEEAAAKQAAREQAQKEAEERARREAKERAERAAKEKAKREAEENARREAQEKARKEAQEKARKEAQEKARKEAEGAEMKSLYHEWRNKCEDAFAAMQPLKTFPQPPERACFCSLTICIWRKEEVGLAACRHDLERLLRASPHYSASWLRGESFKWHPDQFKRRCDPSCQQQLGSMAEEVYKIYGELIAAARG